MSLMEIELQALNRRLLAYLRAAALRRPSTRRSGPFVVTFDDDDNPYLNYAIPEADADPSSSDVADLIALFAAHGRKPRLEFIHGAAPKVEAALLAEGFAVEARPPVMLCASPQAVVMPETDGIEVCLADSGSDLIAIEQAQAQAYGMPSSGPAGLNRTLRAGGLVAFARDAATSAIVGGGIAVPPVDGVSEIAGIGVVPSHRRRGAAGAMTALLAREAFARGFELLWLTPGGPEAERIYARAGFASVSQALHMSR